MGAGGMTTHVELRPGAFADSVTLLQVSRTVQGLPGVAAAQVAMATALNLEVLAGMGFDIPTEATPNDMVVALRLDDPGALDAALAGVAQALADAGRRPTGSGGDLAPARTSGAALRETGDDAVVLISVPGANALPEAMDAVDAGRDVMIFSDNVPVEQEVALKRAAAERGVLVMGPDCGTAVVDGVGLGFANVVAPGPVGMVAASGNRLPAAARAARPRRRRCHLRPGRGWARPVQRGGRARDPRGPAPPRPGPADRADRARLQAAGTRGRRRHHDVRRRARHAGEPRCSATASPISPPRPSGCCSGSSGTCPSGRWFRGSSLALLAPPPAWRDCSWAGRCARRPR